MTAASPQIRIDALAIDADELLCEIDREEVADGGLAAFMRLAWDSGGVESDPLVWSWHLDLIAKHLEAVSRRELLRLVINVPPAHSKSSITCVFWPAWHWGPFADPGHKWMFTSFDGDLSRRDAAKSKDLISSFWYQRRWGVLTDPTALKRYGLEPCEILRSGSASKGKSARADSASQYYTTKMGMRFSTFFGGKAIGWHAHTQVCDDPTKPKTIQDGGELARRALESTLKTWKGTYSSRKAGRASNFARVVIMQRLHESDLAGVCLAEGYQHVCLPTEFEPDHRCMTQWGADPRTEQGELLCPERFGPPEVSEIKRTELSERDYAAQHQQCPSPEGGALFKRAWFERRWQALPSGMRLLMSVDANFKETVDGSFWVVQVWGAHAGEFYLVDQMRARSDISETMAAMVSVRSRWPRIGQVLVEGKANGPAIISLLKGKIPGILEIEPEGGKYARANAVEPYWRAGNVLLPESFLSDPRTSVQDFVEEHIRFPVGAADDQVDAGSQGLGFLTGKVRCKERFNQAMANVRKGLVR